MTNQVILNGSIILPEARMDKFSCWEEVLTRQVTMVSGRVVLEGIGRKNKIWRASYQFDYMGNDKLRQVMAVLRPDSRDEMVTSSFLCDSITNPSYAFAKKGVPLWHNFAFTLREVRPHA